MKFIVKLWQKIELDNNDQKGKLFVYKLNKNNKCKIIIFY